MKQAPTARKTRDFHVIIAAAGSGERFRTPANGAPPKQYVNISGRSVLRHSIDKFREFSNLKSLHVVIDPTHTQHYMHTIAGLNLPLPVPGGETRNISIFNALSDIPDLKSEDIILIHDAARPNVSPEAIENLLGIMEECDAASLAIAVSDTLRRSENFEAGEIVDRGGLWALQTPQAFRYGVLKKAHEAARDKNFTDDTTLVSTLGVPVKLVQGSKTNIKITTPEDFYILEKLMTEKTETRTGMGFDVHAFSKEKGRKLILCGVEIPYEFGLEGHSDADVGLHALTDAILGATGEGDIGLHFPPSNPEFKNMDSRIFLEKAAAMLTDKNGVILNADITIICENPKISPHRAAMKNKVAEILKLDPSRVNIKGTTTEGLGFTGRGEGIAAQAVVSVRL